MNSIRSLSIAGLLTLIAAGCASNNAPSVVDNGKAIASINISPHQDTLGKNSTVKFQATARYADGSTKDVTNDVTWDSSAPSVATISKDGTVTTSKPGLVDITADYKGAKGNEHFVVTP